jgi:predicted AlkP superfamily phosphohydrolase/phosphomutase
MAISKHVASGRNARPLVIFGIDGADADCLQRWGQEGQLPTIAALMQRGCWGRIGGPELTSTHGTWLSFYSGISRREHGYYFNRQLQPGTYDFQRMTARDARALPFWSHFRGTSRKVAIIDALDTTPLAGVKGRQLGEWSVQKQYNTATSPAASEPPSLLDDAQRLVGPPIPIEVFEPRSSVGADVAAYQRLLKRIRQKGTLCCHWLAQEPFDLTVITFVEAHTAAHRLWDYRPGGSRQRETTPEGAELSTAIRSVYQAIDSEMGLVLKQLPEDTNVFVVSLFGMKDLSATSGLIETFCRQFGYHIPVPGPAGIWSPLNLFRRLVPFAWRAELSRCLPLRLQERLQGEHLRCHTDWTQTTAFPVPSLYSSSIRVNLQGREPQGIVAPGRAYGELLDRIEADLRQLVDVPSGEPAVETVTRTVAAYRCDPPRDLPDLTIEWKASPSFRHRVRHLKGELVQTQPWYNRSSYHTFTGFVSAAGPSIAPAGDLGEVSLLDCAPTFLHLMAEPVPSQMTGHVIERMVRPWSAGDPYGPVGKAL